VSGSWLDSVSECDRVQAIPHSERRITAEIVIDGLHNQPFARYRGGMSAPQLRNFINGEYVPAAADDGFDVIDPATEATYATSPVSGAADVDAAFSAAATAFETWGESTPAERQLALFRIADAMEARAEEFADLESKDTGKPRASLVQD
jgi:hypothetical protein